MAAGRRKESKTDGKEKKEQEEQNVANRKICSLSELQETVFQGKCIGH